MNIFFEIKYTEAILSNSTRKLFWFEITKILIARPRPMASYRACLASRGKKNKLIVLFIIIVGTFSFPVVSAGYRQYGMFIDDVDYG